MSTQNDPMAEIKASFFIECEELLEALQDGLQTIDDGEDDPETINVVFRAVHSIKGGAGAFGLEGLVRFAHRYESTLDEVRSGKLTPGPDEIRLFFQACDHLSDLVAACRNDEPLDEDAGASILQELDKLLGGSPETEEEEDIDFQPMGLALDLDLDLPALPHDIAEPEEPAADAVVSTDPRTRYQIRFTPELELFETGNEPFLLLKSLSNLGEMVVHCDTNALPDWANLAPETPYISWDIELLSDVDLAELQSVFEFVEGLCKLSITVTEPGAEGTVVPVQPPASDDAAELPPLPAIEPEDVATDLPPLPDLPVAPPDLPEVQPTPAIKDQVEAPKPKQTADRKPEAQPAKSSGVVRVDLDRIERLVNLVGELVINQAMLSQSLEQANLSPHSDAMNGLEEFQRLTRDIQDSVMMIRAQPVKSLFQRMSRIVREASTAVDKNVRLVTIGETTEVDKTVIERLADPLTHMIRNAVDHGLESTEDRLNAGKPAEGQVRLSAAHRSGRVIIEVADDGGGINRAKVLEIAESKGLVPADANLSDTEIDNLLFMPGFSTATAVSDLSGRGVGMDVVKTAIQSLGGRISTTSEAGVGTTFSISLPLTLAVLDGMVVNIADETLVLPLNVVVETLSLQNEDLDMIRPGEFVVRVRGQFVPLFDLGVALGYRTPKEDYADSIVLLIALEDDSRAALIIDGIQDQRQVVIKGLDASFPRAPGIAAATILGDGQIALILDPADIVSNISGSSGLTEASLKTGATA